MGGDSSSRRFRKDHKTLVKYNFCDELLAVQTGYGYAVGRTIQYSVKFPRYLVHVFDENDDSLNSGMDKKTIDFK